MAIPPPGSLVVAQDDITDPRTQELVVPRGAHLLYLEHVSSSRRDIGHLCFDSSGAGKVMLDPGVEFVPAGDKSEMFVLRGKFHDLPICGWQVRSAT